MRVMPPAHQVELSGVPTTTRSPLCAEQRVIFPPTGRHASRQMIYLDVLRKRKGVHIARKDSGGSLRSSAISSGR